MRLKQNITLITLVICLLGLLVGINNLDILSFSAVQDKSARGEEIKVDNSSSPTQHQDNIEIIWDVSNSMWATVDKQHKISLSKEILHTIVNQLPKQVNLGLRVFGSKQHQDNKSLLAIPLATNNRLKITSFINRVTPAGKSPIGLNLLQAKKDLVATDGRKHIILVTDGQDTGRIMPNNIIQEIKQLGIKTHVIHVGEIKQQKQLQLKSLAKLGDGKYFTYFEAKQIVPTLNFD
ncbi:vWA domain-containing protein [Halanaerobaculum tunisiense]